jgi:diphosphomevalonate decarboxylase
LFKLENRRNIKDIVKEKGKVTWSSPSNIALVKYWGKKGFQVPANPSLSMTLDRSVTVMEMAFERKEENQGVSVEFTFEGQKNPLFEDKIVRYLKGLPGEYSWIEGFHYRINSRNTFPHSAGIASSASSMSALALCLLSVRQEAYGEKKDDQLFRLEASDMARQASGSACRSVYGGYVIWGQVEGADGSNERYAMPFNGPVHEEFHDMKDAILLVSSAKKSVSSRAGHGLMNEHPFAVARYQMAARNAKDLLNALKTGDMQAFIQITEQEALTLHALMMSSDHPFILLQPNSLILIEKIRQFREETKQPVCFTIDAGPNIHLLYPASAEAMVKDWITNDLGAYLEEGKWIDDSMGTGPVKLNDL